MPIHYSEGEFPLDLYTNNYTERFQNQGAISNVHNCDCCQPYNINHAVEKLQRTTLMITNISTTATYTISITIDYSDGTSKTYALEKGKKYKVQYLANGAINTLVGVITNIGKVNSNSSCSCDCCSGSNDYIIRLDASSNYTSVVEDIRTSNIRTIEPYVAHADEDTTILNARSSGVTVAGLVQDLVITNATIDDEGTILSGTIIKGNVDEKEGIIVDGCSIGTNSLGNTITVDEAEVIGGTITSGTIMSGKMGKYTITTQGNIDCCSNIMNNCIVEAKSATIVATECNVVGSKAYDGTVINPVIESSTVVGGKRSGKDMVTTGAMVIGDIAYGGTVSGGTLIGGTATGMINGKPYVIENGITTDGTSLKCTVTNGKIVGGKTVNGSIIGATVYGGIAECGITTGGTTTVADSVESFIRPDSSTLPSDIICKCPKVYGDYTSMIGDMIIWIKTNNGYSPRKV